MQTVRRPTFFLMPDGSEPDFDELRERIRKWVQHYWLRCEAGGTDRKGFAEFLGFSPATISNLVNGRERPGLLCLSRIHFRFNRDASEMMRFDPPRDKAHLTPLQLPDFRHGRAGARK